jgi:hypothetical protein
LINEIAGIKKRYCGGGAGGTRIGLDGGKGALHSPILLRVYYSRA